MRLKNKNSARNWAMCAAVVSSIVGCALPQPAEPAPTVWEKLGIPQAFGMASDQLLNASGDFPKCELKPPLKKLADAANLKSKIPAIKAAAKIKQAEDEAAQKIKAVKYLATMGCGCYDEGDEITDALIASLDDCTEEVRFATAEALYKRSKEQKKEGTCTRCGDSCCNEKLVKKLADVAYGVDDEACEMEPSERVREMAVKTLEICCPQQCQSYCTDQLQYEQALPSQPYELAPPTEPGIYLEGPERPAPKTFEKSGGEDGKTFEGSGEASAQPNAGKASVKAVSFQTAKGVQTKHIAARGHITAVNPANGTALVATDVNVQLAVGSIVNLSHRYQLGRVSTIGQGEVVSSRGGEAIIRPMGLLSVHRISVNDMAVLFQ